MRSWQTLDDVRWRWLGTLLSPFPFAPCWCIAPVNVKRFGHQARCPRRRKRDG